jgi:hypothetical protein
MNDWKSLFGLNFDQSSEEAGGWANHQRPNSLTNPRKKIFAALLQIYGFIVLSQFKKTHSLIV